MNLLAPEERGFAEALSDLVYCNPFLPERMACERRALGDAFVSSPSVWSAAEPAAAGERANLVLMREHSSLLAETLRARIREREANSDHDVRDLILYEDVCLYLLYEQIRDELHELIERMLAPPSSGGGAADPARLWPRFRAQFNRFLGPGADGVGVRLPTGHQPEHVFACFFQIRRAFSHIYHYLVGGSMPAARLRASVWQSIFTHDFRRYYASLHHHMADFATLITGESGTGKELVARAIGRSRYIPFDSQRTMFVADFAASFAPVNLSALSPTLIESELFGHRKGAFTGAVADRQGYLESCPPDGAVFLDEIGELDPAIQVKLLRVLQSRTFARLGETRERQFAGKIIAATNRDLAAEIARGAFRADFYYRLCSDVIRAPSLREQLADAPADLPRMIHHIASRLVGDEAASDVGRQVHGWIRDHLGPRYAWPGNFRELEQCVRNIIIRGTYAPLAAPASDEEAVLLRAIREVSLTADDLLTCYARLAYARTGSYVAAAERLGVDRRTVRARVTGSAAGG